MAGISYLGPCGCQRKWARAAEVGSGLRVSRSADRGPKRFSFSAVSEAYAFSSGRLSFSSTGKASTANAKRCVNMALVDERPSRSLQMPTNSGVLAYDLVQGALVRWNSLMDKSVPDPPTAVLLHGILGCRKNWGSFARRLAQEFPMWQFLLVDLRCHGESTSLTKHGPHTVASAALDVLKLVRQLRVTPRVLIGHSFGGKVALSMVEQAAKPLARPVRVWVLDATPGRVRPGGHGEDRPGELIAFLSRMPKQVSSKREVVEALLRDGFSADVSQWVATNLRRSEDAGSSPPGFSWVFDLNGISDMYRSYEETNLWKIVEDVPRGVHVNFLKAERSLHRWALEDIQRIYAAEELAAEEGAGVQMHVLEDAGHWVWESGIVFLPLSSRVDFLRSKPSIEFLIQSYSSDLRGPWLVLFPVSCRAVFFRFMRTTQMDCLGFSPQPSKDSRRGEASGAVEHYNAVDLAGARWRSAGS